MNLGTSGQSHPGILAETRTESQMLDHAMRTLYTKNTAMNGRLRIVDRNYCVATSEVFPCSTARRMSLRAEQAWENYGP